MAIHYILVCVTHIKIIRKHWQTLTYKCRTPNNESTDVIEYKFCVQY